MQNDQQTKNKFQLRHLRLEVLQEFGADDENNDPIGVKGDQRPVNGRKQPKAAYMQTDWKHCSFISRN